MGQQQDIFLFGLVSGLAVAAVGHYVLAFVKDTVVAVMGARQTAATGSSAKPGPVLEHHGQPGSILSPPPSPPPSVGEDVMARLETELAVPSAKLSKMVRHLVSEMKKGLQAHNQTLKMLPSYVTARPVGTESGSVLALDLGGSNFRVCLVNLEGQGLVRMKQRKYVVSEDLKKGSGKQLFDFFADCIAKFLIELGLEPETYRPLGFTFSFPVKQEAIDQGRLMHWNKGFTCSGVEGKDVGSLLNEALERRDVGVRVKAIVNDTVGTLIAHAYNDPQTYIGVILGTGTNAAYVENVEEISKTPLVSPTGEMIVNTEWGAYSEPSVLPLTRYDRALDRASSNPKAQIFEKMISGMYLGEITRLILVDLISTGELFHGSGSEELKRPYNFETANMSRIERYSLLVFDRIVFQLVPDNRDHTLDLSDTKSLLEDILKVQTTTLKDRRIVKKVCELVGTRAARLSAAGVVSFFRTWNALMLLTSRVNVQSGRDCYQDQSSGRLHCGH